MTRLGARWTLVDGRLVPGDVEVVDGRIAAITTATPGSDRAVVPGFVDLQVNGFAGVDFSRATVGELAEAARAMALTGVTAFLPTLVTAPVDAMVRALGVLADAEIDPDGATVLGAHLEGPFLAPERLGAHDARSRLDPDPVVLDELLGAGPVRRVTIAPERPGAEALIARLVERGIEVSAGHTVASADQAHRAFDLGVTSTTHHGNAMANFHHREPGVFGAALVRRDVTPTLIVDGHHLHPDTVRLVFSTASERVALVTDAVAPAATDVAEGQLGDAPFRVVDGAVRNQAGDLAGSVLTIDAAVRNCVELGIDRAAALGAASTQPRRLLGLPLAAGVEVGAAADLVVLDADLGVVDTLVPRTGSPGEDRSGGAAATRS